MEKISTVQKSTDTSIGTLTDFIKSSLTTQDKVISSLKTGQESMDRRMTTVTDNVQKQMDTMNTSMLNLQKTMLRIVGFLESDSKNQHCEMAINTQDNTILGNTLVLLGGGLDKL